METNETFIFGLVDIMNMSLKKLSELEQESKQEPIQQLEEGFTPFEEICPKWSQHIEADGRLNDKVDGLSLISHKYCIVGEAYGFSDNYCGWFGEGPRCDDCKYFATHIFQSRGSKDRGDYADYYINKEERDKFVKHWNEAHRK